MAIRGSKNYYLIDRIQRRHFIRQAVDVGISEDEAEGLIDSVIDSTEAAIQKTYQILPNDSPKKLADKILKGLSKQFRKLASQKHKTSIKNSKFVG